MVTNHRELQHAWIEIESVKLHYWRWPGAGPAVLCLHGLTSNGRYWSGLVEHLDHPVTAIDFRGRGMSDKPASGAYGLDRHASDAAALIRKIGLGPCCVIGHSMGATVAVRLAAEHPELVSRLVIVDGGTPGEEFHNPGIYEQLKASLDRLSVRYENADAYLQYWRELSIVQPWTDAYEQYLTADIEELPDGSVVCQAVRHAVEEDLGFAIHQPEAEFEALLRQVKCPSLAVWAPCGHVGIDSPLVSRETIEKVAALVPDCRLITLDGVNHYDMLFRRDALEHLTLEVKDLIHTDAGL